MSMESDKVPSTHTHKSMVNSDHGSFANKLNLIARVDSSHLRTQYMSKRLLASYPDWLTR